VRFAPTANFTAAPLSGAAPLAVAFTDTSAEDPTSWAWDFDDDGVVDSTEQNPVHTYASGGNYTVNLTVTNPQGSNSMVRTDYIRVGDRVSKTWTVGSSGCDFTALNDAFTNAFLEDGDTIAVYNGSYTLTGSTAKALTIFGEGADVVTVSPSSATISGAGTVVEGMTFSGGMITFGSANGTIRNCTFQGMTSNALLSGAGIVFEQNTVRNNTINQPIEVTGNDCLITNNTFAYNGQLPSGTETPIRLKGCNGVTVAWNDFNGNTGGIGLRASGAGNAIYLNNFAGYNVAVRSSGGATPQAITWNAPATIDYTCNGASHSGLLGNYWSTYTGTDANGDGIGDTAYSLPVTGQTDNYPLTDRVRYYFGAEHVIASIGIAPASATMNVTDTLQFAATAYEADGYPDSGIAFAWSSSNETVGTVNGTGFFTAMAPGTTEVAAVNGNVTGTSTVTVLAPSIEAGFTASPLTGEVPLTVQFTDTTDGPGISAWAWDFENDGVVDSTEQNPTYTYSSVRNYSVNLTVTGSPGRTAWSGRTTSPHSTDSPS
jgi:PKD repeat protein